MPSQPLGLTRVIQYRTISSNCKYYQTKCDKIQEDDSQYPGIYELLKCLEC